MCGFVGFVGGDDVRSAEVMQAIVGHMADTLAHRGPDDNGTWADAEAGIALGHRRLAILDLSAAGHQPMHSASGRFVIVFNGEVYNHLDLRQVLQGRPGGAPTWRGHADTETLLAAFDAWGIEATLRRCVGMFALAVWDRQGRVLTLARDRLGEKPLYYGWVRGALVFGSELKALRAYPGFDRPLCREALGQFLRCAYVPAPLSIYEGVFKLEPGGMLEVRGEGLKANGLAAARVWRYWSLEEAVAAGRASTFADEGEALEALAATLGEAVRSQRLADVPLGVFLSGGVDSSTIAALMQPQAGAPVRTFTVGFEAAGFDEAPAARAVAAHLGTEHTELYVTAAEARAVIPQLPRMYDEPFADSSQIPTHLVCRAARGQVTVALSGDGGDELFGGYNRYLWGPRLWCRLAWLPAPLRRALAGGIGAVPPGVWDRLGSGLAPWLSGPDGVVRPGEKAHKLAATLGRARTLDELYLRLATEWDPPPCRWAVGPAVVPCPPAGLTDAAERMMFCDALTYLPGDILCKLDRAAMAVSLETRAPFLDHRVVELAWRLPLGMKMRHGQGKWALRQVLYRFVPPALIERPKAGFALPVGQWLRGPLRDWAEDLLDEGRLRRAGYLDPHPIRQVWRQHLSGRRDWTARLWTVLMFESWLAEVQGPSSSAPNP